MMDCNRFFRACKSESNRSFSHEIRGWLVRMTKHLMGSRPLLASNLHQYCEYQSEKVRRRTQLCKFSLLLKVRLHTAINRANSVS